MTGERDDLPGVRRLPSVAPPVVGSGAARHTPARGPLAQVVAAPSRPHRGRTPLAAEVTWGAWLLLVLDVAVVVLLPRVQDDGFFSSVATWGDHPAWPLVLSAAGAATLGIALAVTRGATSADLRGVWLLGAALLVGAAGAASAVAAVVLLVLAGLLVAAAVLVGIALVLMVVFSS